MELGIITKCIGYMVYNNHLLYSKQLSREKTFVNFVAICVKVFSRVWHLLVAPANNPQKFSPTKVSHYTVCPWAPPSESGRY